MRKLSFRRILAMLGVFTMSTLVSLSVVACNSGNENSKKPKTISELVVESINNASYAITVLINSSVNNFKNSINADFIKEKLEQENKKNFNNQDFF